MTTASPPPRDHLRMRYMANSRPGAGFDAVRKGLLTFELDPIGEDPG